MELTQRRDYLYFLPELLLSLFFSFVSVVIFPPTIRSFKLAIYRISMSTRKPFYLSLLPMLWVPGL